MQGLGFWWLQGFALFLGFPARAFQVSGYCELEASGWFSARTLLEYRSLR